MLAAGSQAGVHREVHAGGSGQTVGKYATGGLVDLEVRRESCGTNGLAERVCEGAEQGYWVVMRSICQFLWCMCFHQGLLEAVKSLEQTVVRVFLDSVCVCLTSVNRGARFTVRLFTTWSSFCVLTKII